MSTQALELKYPIVLIHGLGAKGSIGPLEYFHGVPKHLRSFENEVFVPNLTSWEKIETRAEELKHQIQETIPEGRVNLIGHSMGGLDARVLASDPEFKERIASVVTIGTPNQGTIVADIALGLVSSQTKPVIDRLLKKLGPSTEIFHQVTHQNIREVYSKKVTNTPGIAYFSATSIIQDPVVRTALPIFWIPYKIIKKHEGENDGFVSEESSKLGEHICTYIGDHYGQIGQILGLSRGLDHIRFFEEIIERLKKEGF